MDWMYRNARPQPALRLGWTSRYYGVAAVLIGPPKLMAFASAPRAQVHGEVGSCAANDDRVTLRRHSQGSLHQQRTTLVKAKIL